MTTDVFLTEGGQRTAHLSGTVRNTGSGWAVLSNTGHEPSGIAGVDTLPDRLRVHYLFNAARVRGCIVTPDETYAAQGLRCGASVGLTYADVFLYGGPGSTPLDPSTIVSPTGNLWLSGWFRL